MKKRPDNRNHKGRCLALLLVALFALVPPPGGITPSSISGTAQANTYSKGYKQYAKGNYNGAASELKKALRRSKKSSEKANIYKLLGICQYMLGQKSSSAASFKASLKLNPRMTISKSEVLSESVITFFNQQKGARNAAPKTAAPAATSKRSSIFATARKTTFLTVSSNTPGATVLIDGIFAGSVGTRLEVDSGQATVELQAKGYITAKRSLNIVKNQQNSISINLAKPRPKPKPRPKKQARTAARSNNAKTKAAGKRKSRLFAEEEEEENFPVAPTAGTYSARVPAPTPPQGYAPPPNLPQAPMYAAPPPQAPVYAQPAYPQQAPVYQQPAPVYAAPQPYGYAQQPYMAQPMPQPMAQPLPQIAPNPYALPPPPVDAPSMYTDGGSSLPSPVESPATSAQDDLGPPVGDIDAFSPPSGRSPSIRKRKRRSLPPLAPRRSTPSRKSRSRSSGSSSSSGSSGGQIFAALMPFGIGQYYNGSPILGTALLVGEAAGIFGYFYFRSLAEAKSQEARQFEQAVNEDRDNYTEEDLAAYQTQVNTYITENDSFAVYSIAAFGVLWGIGTIEALVSGPEPKKKKRRRSSRRRYSLLEKQADAKLFASDILKNDILRPYEADWQLSLVSPLIPDINQPEPQEDKFGLSFDYRF